MATTKRRRPASSRARRTRAAAPAKGTRERNKEATRERIVAAALTLFQEKGFDATTTKAIARRARIAEGTVFNYFPTKDDIALHFFEVEVDRAIAAVRGRQRTATTLEERLFTLIQSQLEYLEPHQKFIGSALVEALKPMSGIGLFSLRAHALRRRYIDFVGELMAEALPGKRFASVRRWAPEAFWLYYLGALLFWLHDDSPAKERTLAFLDRTLTIGVGILRRAS